MRERSGTSGLVARVAASASAGDTEVDLPVASRAAALTSSAGGGVAQAASASGTTQTRVPRRSGVMGIVVVRRSGYERRSSDENVQSVAPMLVDAPRRIVIDAAASSVDRRRSRPDRRPAQAAGAAPAFRP